MDSGYDIDRVKCIAESAKSLLMQCECEEFEDDDSHEDSDKCWVPKKQITDDSEVYSVGDEGQLCITEWLAEQRGWL
jgi:hypothetical protein